MNTKIVLIRDLVRAAPSRPHGYMDDVKAKAVGRTEQGDLILRLDDWAALKDKYRPSRGLGDTVAKLTEKTGIKPCGGCEKRRKLLNKFVPYKK